MSVGMMGFMGIGVESAAGAQSAAIVDFLPFVSENLAVTRNDLPDPSIWAAFDERRMYNGPQRVEGGVQTVFHPILSGYLLRLGFDTTTTQPGSAGGVFAAFCGSATGIRIHRFITGQAQFQVGSGSDLPTATIEMNRGPVMGTGSSFMYYGITANALEFSVDAGGFMRLNAELIGRDFGGKSRSTPSYIPQDTFLWNTASVSFEGTGSALFQTLTWRLENNLQAIAKLDGRLRPDLIKRGDFRRVTVSGQMAFQDFTEWNRFQSGSEVPLEATFTGKTITSSGGVVSANEILKIACPRFRYSAYPVNVGGPGPIQIGWSGRAMLDQTSLYCMEVTLVNTRNSGYWINASS